MYEDLRRFERISVCCRVVVRDRYGLWTAVTEDVSARGCQLVTPRLLRPGTRIELALSSDLFAEELELAGRVLWATPSRLGVGFLESSPGELAAERWLAQVVELGAIPGVFGGWRVAPSVVPASSRVHLASRLA